jgi:hypothetical protein
MLIDKTEGHLDEVLKYASTRSDETVATLERSLAFLNNYAMHGDSKIQTRCILFKDFAPRSFYFIMEMRALDGSFSWRTYFNGGLIYHATQSSGAEYPVLSVREKWSIST